MFEGKRLVHADDLVRARIDRVEVRKYFLIDVFYFITAHGRHPSTEIFEFLVDGRRIVEIRNRWRSERWRYLLVLEPVEVDALKECMLLEVALDSETSFGPPFKESFTQVSSVWIHLSRVRDVIVLNRLV